MARSLSRSPSHRRRYSPSPVSHRHTHSRRDRTTSRSSLFSSSSSSAILFFLSRFALIHAIGSDSSGAEADPRATGAAEAERAHRPLQGAAEGTEAVPLSLLHLNRAVPVSSRTILNSKKMKKKRKGKFFFFAHELVGIEMCEVDEKNAK